MEHIENNSKTIRKGYLQLIDHIIPVAKGGHPSDLDNLQLAHMTCNRQKSDKIFANNTIKTEKVISNRILPQIIDWTAYRSKK